MPDPTVSSSDSVTSEAVPWSVQSGLLLLHTLANAIVELSDVTDVHSFVLPYPAEAQRALDRTALACLRRGADPPRSIPDLLDWCRSRPIADWPLDLPEDAVGPEDRLLDDLTGLPTELCREWWVHSRDSLARMHDREVIRAAMRICREGGETAAYPAFRRLMVEKPVLTSADWFGVVSDPLLAPLLELLGVVYQSVPASYSRKGGYATCARCRTLLTPVEDDAWWCERDHCRRQGTPRAGRLLNAEEAVGLVHLDRPLRQFVTWPGQAEVAMENDLTALGLHVEMWPGFDAYDLRVTFPDGHVWALDVKDWAHPGLLGRSAMRIRAEPPYDEAFWVVPWHRTRWRPDYCEVFARNRPAAAGGLPLLTDRDVLAQASARLNRTKGGRDSHA